MVCIEYALVILLFLALVFDLMTDKVPNFLVLSGYAVGMLKLILKYGAFGVLWCFILIVVVWLCFMPAYFCGGLGGGDCKLLAWLALFFEPEKLPEAYFFVFLCGGMIAMVKLFFTKDRTFHFTIATLLGVIIFLVKIHFFERGGA